MTSRRALLTAVFLFVLPGCEKSPADRSDAGELETDRGSGTRPGSDTDTGTDSDEDDSDTLPERGSDSDTPGRDEPDGGDTGASMDTDVESGTAPPVDTGSDSGFPGDTSSAGPDSDTRDTHTAPVDSDGTETDRVDTAGGPDAGIDSDSDAEPIGPEARQTDLLEVQISCDEGDMSMRCDNAARPCIPDEPKILCRFQVHLEGGDVLYDGHAGIERRGRSSIMYDKPNYGLELRLEDGETENPVDFLDMGKESDWILDGSWLDRSFMRNDLVFDTFRELGGIEHYAAESRYAAVSLNGVPQGIYRLVERIKKDDDRIDISDDDGLGGAFVIKQDDGGDLRDSIGMDHDIWQLVYPKDTRATQAQHDGVSAWLDAFSDAMREGRPLDYLDPITTVDFVLVQELAKNRDAYYLSLHLFKDLEGPAHLVPWDIDLSFGQPTLVNEPEARNESPEGWITGRSIFIEDLCRDQRFTSRLEPRWRELRQGRLSLEYIEARMETYLTMLTEAEMRENFAIWPIEDIEFEHIYSEYNIYDVGSFEEEISTLRDWIADRLAWIDETIDRYPAE